MKLTHALVIWLASLSVGNPLAWASPVLCSSITTLGDWESIDGCRDTGARFTLIDSTLPKTTEFVAASILLPAGTIHLVAFNFSGGLTGGTYSLEYNMELATLDTVLGSISGDTSVFGTTTVTTNVFDS